MIHLVPSSPPAPPSLQQRIRAQLRRAQLSGALRPLAAESSPLTQEGLHYWVHRLERDPTLKPRTLPRRDPAFDPFSDPDPLLYVQGWGARHHLLLNKFPITADHALITTRDFEPQQAWLSLEDHWAARHALDALDGLIFYNSGPASGASQRHRHLQLVPLPLAKWAPDPDATARHPGPGRFPLEAAWLAAPAEAGLGEPTESPLLPFRHRLCALPPRATAAQSYAAYRACAEALGVADRQPCYNLLMTREQMLFVPRTQAGAEGILFNALAFTGSLLVPHEAAQALLSTHGVAPLLRAVTGQK